MRNAAILLGVASVMAFPVYAALPSHDLQDARPDSSHQRVNSAGNGKTRAGEQRLLKGQEFHGVKMERTRQQPQGSFLQGARQADHTKYENRFRTPMEPNIVQFPQGGTHRGAASPAIGVASYISKPVAVLNQTASAQSLIPRAPAPARIGGSPGVNTPTTAVLSGTRLKHKP